MSISTSTNTTSRIYLYVLIAIVIPLLALIGLLSVSKTLAAKPVVNSTAVQDVYRYEPLGNSPLEVYKELINNSALNSILFFDDFSVDLSMWNILYGDWYIDQGRLVGQASGYPLVASIYAGDLAWNDYVFQTQVVTETQNTVLYLRNNDSLQNEYMIEFWWENSPYFTNSYFVYKYQDGNFVDLSGGYIHSPVPITSSSILKALISGNHLVIYIDNQFVTEIDDPNPLPNGRIGLGVLWDKASFDDALVTTVPPVMAYPVQARKYAEAGETIAHTLELVNQTGVSDSFDLQIMPGNPWTTTLSTNQVGPIEDGGSITFTTWVDVPTTAQPGENSEATIQASSTTSPMVYTTTAILDSVAITSTNGYFTMESENRLGLVDQVLHIPIGSIDLSQYNCLWPKQVKLTPDSSQIYVHCWGSSNIIIFNTSQNTYINTINLPPSSGYVDFTFTIQGDYVIVGSEDNATVYVIDTATLNIIKSIPSINVKSLSTHPYLPRIFIGGFSCCDSAFIQVLDTDTFTISKSIALGFGIIFDVQVSPDGQWVYASNSDYYIGGIYKLNAQTDLIVGSITSLGGLKYFRVTPDNRIFVTSFSPQQIFVIDGNTFSYLTTIYTDDGTNDMELSCDGNELWIATAIEYMPVINTHDYTIPFQIYIPGTGQSSVALCSTSNKSFFTRKTADTTHASPGESVNYTISSYNYGYGDSNDNLVTDTLPVELNYVDGSLRATSGSYTYQNGVITWTGAITTSYSVDINFEAIVSRDAEISSTITNTAVISTTEEIYSRSSVVNIVPYRNYMPCVSAPCRPLYFDDFSNPTSGWPIVNDELKSLGYMNGEYQILLKSEGWIVFVNKNLGFNDYKVEMDTRPATNLNGATGLIFSLTDNGFFMFLVNDGWYSLWRNDSGTWAQRIGWQSSYAIYPGYQTNHLAVVRSGASTLLYANGIKIAEDYDMTYQGGGVGMVSSAFSQNYDGRFDNFAISPAECNGELPVNITPSYDLSAEVIWIGPNANIIRR